jgi:biotin-dependent carboxylase-like uncharacterized protein
VAGPALRAVVPTPFVTVQDGGRRGWRRFGLSGAGAMDKLSLVTANALVGNRATEAALEFAYAAGDWLIEASTCRVAVTGGAFDVRIDGTAVPPFSSALARRGQTLHIGGAARRVWGYLAIAGGFDLPMTFGSRSTHARTGIGGFGGRALREGDALPLRLDRAPNEPERLMGAYRDDEGPFRVVLGPQADYFDQDAIELLSSGEYRVTWHQDRMAYQLDGPRLRHARGFNIITDGTVPGALQIPGTGQPIVLMQDSGSIGGYPKIGAVIEADLGRLAQTRPGGEVRFQVVSLAEAHEARRRYLARMQRIAQDIGNPLPPPER